MPGSESNLQSLLREMQPKLHPEIYAFCVVPPDRSLVDLPVIGSIREPEGLTVILEEREARARGLIPVFRCAWITLGVHSDLQAVGLTAAVTAALAGAGIACNVVAGAYHDHLFVPADRGAEALAVLEALRNR